MADRTPTSFSVFRLLWRAIAWAAAAGFLWYYTRTYNAAFTVWLAKAMHAMVGYPAPYLFGDQPGYSYFWHATMFPPVVGLTLGSYWLRWPDRLLRAAVGYVAHGCLTATAVCINDSPYLQQTEFLVSVTTTLADANYLLFGVVVWVLAAGPWYVGGGRVKTVVGRGTASTTKLRRVLVSVGRRVRHGWATRVAVLVAAIAAVVPLFALTGSAKSRAARAAVADAMREVPYFPQPSTEGVDVEPEERRARDKAATEAILKMQAAILADGEAKVRSSSMYYLVGQVQLSLRPDDSARAEELKRGAALALAMAYKTKPGH